MDMESDLIIAELKANQDEERAKYLQRFFKTGNGEYGQGDIFWGLSVPKVREIVKRYKGLSFIEITKVINQPYHEARLAGLLLLVHASKKFPKESFETYLRIISHINNWDLVDVSAEHVVGAYLWDKDRSLLFKLAASRSLWDRRIAILSTFYFIKKGSYEDTLEISKILLHDKQDLIQKAVGWMLREVGKRCSPEVLETFLYQHASQMPRTMLRYAIERFPIEKRLNYLRIKHQPRI